MINKDDVRQLLDWVEVGSFFRRHGPQAITFTIKKTKSDTRVKIDLHEKETKKRTRKKHNR